MGLTIEEVAVLAGAILTIVGLLSWIYRVFANPSDRLRGTLDSFGDTVRGLESSVSALNHTIELINRELLTSQEDRREIRKLLKTHDDEIRKLQLATNGHEQQLKSLWKEANKE